MMFNLALFDLFTAEVPLYFNEYHSKTNASHNMKYKKSGFGGCMTITLGVLLLVYFGSLYTDMESGKNDTISMKVVTNDKLQENQVLKLSEFNFYPFLEMVILDMQGMQKVDIWSE